MKAKGVVRDILEWKTSREYFYWRVKRRLAEKKIRDVFHVADPSKTHNEITQAMQVRTTALCVMLAFWRLGVVTRRFLLRPQTEVSVS